MNDYIPNIGPSPKHGTEADAKAEADLAKALQAKHVALAAGLAGAAATGKPISAMFEYEDAKLKLSVFVEKAGAFSEVFLDPTTGKVLSTSSRRSR